MGVKKEYETWSEKKEYIIMKDGLFFDGCNRYGTDNEMIARVAKCKWSTELKPIWFMSLNRANIILQGIKKYDYEKNATYRIVEIKTKILVERVDW